MRTRLVVALAVGALGIAAVACSSSSSTSTPTPPDNDVTSFCSDWGTAMCQGLVNICQFDATACATYQTTQCSTFASAATMSGTRTYNQPGGKACIDALKGAYGNNPSSISSATLASVQDTCNKAFTGTVQSDGKCTSTYDCDTSKMLTCSPIPGGTASVCASGNPKNVGDICSAGDTCQGDSYCQSQGTNAEPKCVADPTTGGACSASIPCGAANTCANGTCQAKLTVSATCSSNSDCSSGYCDLYAPAGCATALTFARGSDDCKGVAGIDQGGGADAGVTQDSGGGGMEASVEASSGDAAGE